MIAIASDHAGYDLKEKVKGLLQELGVKVKDFGCNSRDSVDYSDYANDLSAWVGEEKGRRGILICGTGIGMSMASNKFSGVRAALCCNTFMAYRSRLHNKANVLCMGADVVGFGVAKNMVETWIKTHFEGGRHARRVGKFRCA